MLNITTGNLRDLVTVRKWSDIPNVALGIDQTFDTGRRRMAKIEPVGTGIYWGSKQTAEGVTHRVYVRATTDITAEHVVECKNVRYRVMRVAPLGNERRFTVLEVKELGAIA